MISSFIINQFKISTFRERGVKELITIYNENKNRTQDDLKWGEEIEYMICRQHRGIIIP